MRAVLTAQATSTAPASAQHAPGVHGHAAGSGADPAGKSYGYKTTPAVLSATARAEAARNGQAVPREAAPELHTAPLPSSAEGQSAEQPSTIWEEDEVQHEVQPGIAVACQSRGQGSRWHRWGPRATTNSGGPVQGSKGDHPDGSGP
ncbi:hypothetical protein HaLaN_01685 [Haematococcus lacustris]|uniref:Uncharacterized protein n=1 Tax=Haematococcus lacustris TaxID=44745 RepID=A0A699YGE3_HAELA|nr:hypothetical protein HaLaN_01685 [Haematococcus lacustris]